MSKPEARLEQVYDATARYLQDVDRLTADRLAAPTVLMAGLLIVVISAGPSRLSWFLSGDHLRHLGLTTRTLEAGTLEYGMLSYPHGWHAVMAAMWASAWSFRRTACCARSVSFIAAIVGPVSRVVTALKSLTELHGSSNRTV